MAEGVAAGGTVIAGATFDDPKAEPPVDPQAAPLGWTWNRADRKWRPKKSTGRGGYAKTPGGGPPNGAGPAADTGAPPDQRERDPDPGWFRDENSKVPSASKSSRQLSFDDVPQQVKNDIAGFAGLIGAPILGMLQAADPYCGSVLAQNYTPIVDAVLPLLCRSERIVNYFMGDQSDWLLWGKLAMALAPVGKAVYDHHIAGTITVVKDPDTGAVQVMRKDPGQAGYGQHLQPPQPFDASAHAA